MSVGIPLDTMPAYLAAIISVRATMQRPKGFAYTCAEEFVQAHGEAFTPQPLPRGYRLGRPKQCFDNAARLMLRRSDLTYVEGYGLGVIPTEHAWVVHDDGTVIDPTWEWGTEQHPCEPGALYGVRFPRELVALSRARGCPSLLQAWQLGHPLLRQPYTPEAALAAFSSRLR